MQSSCNTEQTNNCFLRQLKNKNFSKLLRRDFLRKDFSSSSQQTLSHTLLIQRSKRTLLNGPLVREIEQNFVINAEVVALWGHLMEAKWLPSNAKRSVIIKMKQQRCSDSQLFSFIFKSILFKLKFWTISKYDFLLLNIAGNSWLKSLHACGPSLFSLTFNYNTVSKGLWPL